MSIDSTITILEKLINLHQNLNELALNKLEIIKNGDMPALVSLLNKEQTYVKAITSMEEERELNVLKYLQTKKMSNVPLTITAIIELAEPSEKLTLERLKAELLAEASKLQQRNDLNQQLIYQSLQFVNMSLDLIKPTKQTYNYEKPTQQQQGSHTRSMFDSQA